MALDLVNRLTNEFRGGILDQIASVIGETPEKTQTALGSLVPAFLSGLAHKALTPEGANDVLDQIRSHNLTLVSPEDVSRGSFIAALTHTGPPLLESLFGSRAEPVVNWISSSAKITRNSAASLASLCAPIVLGSLGRRLGSEMTASRLSGLLGIPGTYLQYAPAGLFRALGFDSSAAAGRRTVKKSGPQAKTRSAYTRKPASWRRLILPMFLVVGAIALLVYLLRTPQPATAILP